MGSTEHWVDLRLDTLEGGSGTPCPSLFTCLSLIPLQGTPLSVGASALQHFPPKFASNHNIFILMYVALARF